MWTKEEINLLQRLFAKATLETLENKIKKSYKAIYRKAKSMGLTRQTRNDWSKLDIKFLKENYKNFSKEALIEYFHRTYVEIVSKANKLKLTRNRWDKEELLYLTKNFHKKTNKEMCKYLDKNIDTVLHKARELNLYRTKKKGFREPKWTTEELDYLRSNYNLLPIKVLKEAIKRTVSSIEHKAQRLGLTLGNKETEIEKIVENCLINGKYLYIKQGRIGRLRPDFIINNNIIVECNGTYWHCDRRKYVNGPISDMQKQHSERDLRKYKYYKDNDYRLIILWETEILKYTNKQIENIIFAVINGDIDYYDSSKSVEAEMPMPR